MAELTLPRPATRLQAAAILAVCLLSLAGLLVGGRLVARSIEQLEAASTTARLQSEAARDVITTLQAAETGQRGFLLTGRDSYLDPFHAASGKIGAELDALNEAAAGTKLQSDAAELTRLAMQKMAELDETVRLAQAGGVEAAKPIVLTDAGRMLMEEAGRAAARMAERADADRATRATKLRRRQEQVSAAVLVGLGLGLVLLTAAALRLLWTGGALQWTRRQMRTEAARLHAAVEHLPEGIAVFDEADRLTLSNARVAPCLGLSPEQTAPGTPFAAIALAARLEPPILAEPRPELRPTTAEARQGGRVLEIWRSPMPGGGQMLAIADVTRRTEAEAIARQAQKMEMIGQMTGGVAHDFNNLLQIVSANLELAARRASAKGADPTLLSRLEQASAGVARGAQLTRQLLAFARRQPLAPVPLDPARVLISMEDMLRRTLGEAIELKLVVAPRLWSMRADPSQLESALLNLALNARDAMENADGVPVGKLTIRVENVTLDPDEARRAEVKAGDYVLFAVNDTGCGMDAEQLRRATEPFFTTKRDGKGTGLGLPMVFGFAKQSGGHFQLISASGRGTTALLYIPRTTARIEPQAAAPAQAPRGNGELVLLVEDDASVRRAAGASLQALGYAVCEASNGDEALTLLNKGLQPAVLFTDVVMPGAISSRELAREAKKRLPELAVLFTTGYTQETIVHDGQLDEDVKLISKPWRTEDLGQALHGAMQSASHRETRPHRRVLLVEDEPLVRMITADALADLGFEVLEAATASAALLLLDPAPDLLVADLGLPDMDGAELILQARSILPDLPVVVASGRSAPPSGDLVFLAKPYDAGELERAVNRALTTPVLIGVGPLPAPAGAARA
ncbi:MAG: response regulator [Acetobacteraceae bacterium]|nr:response regulator [Acetobacteraceae bacterium]